MELHGECSATLSNDILKMVSIKGEEVFDVSTGKNSFGWLLVFVRVRCKHYRHTYHSGGKNKLIRLYHACSETGNIRF